MPAIPGWLALTCEILNFGGTFPRADAGAIKEAGGMYMSSAGDFRALIPGTRAALGSVDQFYTGDGAVAVEQAASQLFSGGYSMYAAADAIEEIGQGLIDSGVSVEDTQEIQIAFAAMTLYQIIQAIAALSSSIFGTAAIPTVTTIIYGIGRKLVSDAGEKLMSDLLERAGQVALIDLMKKGAEKFALKELEGLAGKKLAGQLLLNGVKAAAHEGFNGALFDTGIQTTQMMFGDRDHFDLGELAATSLSWGGGGLLGHPLSGLMGNLLARDSVGTFLKDWGIPKALPLLGAKAVGLVGSTGGMWAGGIGGQFANNLITGQHNAINTGFDPRMLLQVGAMEGMGMARGGSGHDAGTPTEPADATMKPPAPDLPADGSSAAPPPDVGTLEQAHGIFQDIAARHTSLRGDQAAPAGRTDLMDQATNAYVRSEIDATAGRPVDLTDLKSLRAQLAQPPAAGEAETLRPVTTPTTTTTATTSRPETQPLTDRTRKPAEQSPEHRAGAAPAPPEPAPETVAAATHQHPETSQASEPHIAPVTSPAEPSQPHEDATSQPPAAHSPAVATVTTDRSAPEPEIVAMSEEHTGAVLGSEPRAVAGAVIPSAEPPRPREDATPQPLAAQTAVAHSPAVDQSGSVTTDRSGHDATADNPVTVPAFDRSVPLGVGGASAEFGFGSSGSDGGLPDAEIQPADAAMRSFTDGTASYEPPEAEASVPGCGSYAADALRDLGAADVGAPPTNARGEVEAHALEQAIGGRLVPVPGNGAAAHDAIVARLRDPHDPVTAVLVVDQYSHGAAGHDGGLAHAYVLALGEPEPVDGQEVRPVLVYDRRVLGADPVRYEDWTDLFGADQVWGAHFEPAEDHPGTLRATDPVGDPAIDDANRRLPAATIAGPPSEHSGEAENREPVEVDDPASARRQEIGLLRDQWRDAIGEEFGARRTAGGLRDEADRSDAAGDHERAQQLRDSAGAEQERAAAARARAQEVQGRLIELERAEDAHAADEAAARREALRVQAEQLFAAGRPTGHPFDLSGSDSFADPDFTNKPYRFHLGILMAHLMDRPAGSFPRTGDAAADGAARAHGDDGESSLNAGLAILEDPRRLNDVWSTLSDSEKDECYGADPFIGNRDGIPQVDRDKYNRRTLEWLRDLARQQDDTARLQQFDDIAEMLDPAKQEDGQPPYLLSYLDHTLHVAYTLGDPDTADHVAIMLMPAIQYRSAVRYAGETMKDVRQAALSTDPDAETAVILWGGYDNPPALIEAVFPHYAENGADAARGYHEGLRVTHDGPPARTTTIGHSYGGVIAGHAASGGPGLNTDNVIFLGAPGTGIAHVSELRLRGNPEDNADHVFATVAQYDSIQLFPDVHGPSPTDPSYGATVFTTESTPSAYPTGWNPSDHRAPTYLHGRSAHRNIGRIITGKGGDVT